MLTGTIRAQVDRVWDAFWSGGNHETHKAHERKHPGTHRSLRGLFEGESAQAAHRRPDLWAETAGPALVALQGLRAGQDVRDMGETFRDKVFPVIKNLSTNSESAYNNPLLIAIRSLKRPLQWCPSHWHYEPWSITREYDTPGNRMLRLCR